MLLWNADCSKWQCSLKTWSTHSSSLKTPQSHWFLYTSAVLSDTRQLANKVSWPCLIMNLRLVWLDLRIVGIFQLLSCRKAVSAGRVFLWRQSLSLFSIFFSHSSLLYSLYLLPESHRRNTRWRFQNQPSMAWWKVCAHPENLRRNPSTHSHKSARC